MMSICFRFFVHNGLTLGPPVEHSSGIIRFSTRHEQHYNSLRSLSLKRFSHFFFPFYSLRAHFDDSGGTILKA